MKKAIKLLLIVISVLSGVYWFSWMYRYEVVSGDDPFIYALDRWSGEIRLCSVDPDRLGELGYRGRKGRVRIDTCQTSGR